MLSDEFKASTGYLTGSKCSGLQFPYSLFIFYFAALATALVVRLCILFFGLFSKSFVLVMSFSD